MFDLILLARSIMQSKSSLVDIDIWVIAWAIKVSSLLMISERKCCRKAMLR